MVERPQSFIDQLHIKSYLSKVIYPTVHTESDENGSAIKKGAKSVGSLFTQFNVFGPFFNISILWYVTTTNSFYKELFWAILLVNEFQLA